MGKDWKMGKGERFCPCGEEGEYSNISRAKLWIDSFGGSYSKSGLEWMFENMRHWMVLSDVELIHTELHPFQMQQKGQKQDIISVKVGRII